MIRKEAEEDVKARDIIRKRNCKKKNKIENKEAK